jgi:XTP/dITP diphosphohydrolase
VRLLVATTNRGKLVEILAVLAGLPVQIDSLNTYPGVEEAQEDGATFAENARAKATHYSHHTGQIAVADDSGLEIDALGGAPGVRSARFNGTSYPEKFATIQRSLNANRAAGSTARFVCSLAVADDHRIVFEATGVIEGQIAQKPKGTNGFGYDPIFFYPPYGRTLAEVSPAEKTAVSHRGQAFRALRTYLETQLRL